MRRSIRSFATALSIAAVAAALATFSANSAQAQAGGAPPQLKQIALTEKQVEGVLASQKELDAATEKLPDNAMDKPDPKVTAQLDAVVKKYGFADYEEYNVVVENISLVMGGFDPQTKKYIGNDAVLKQQIAAVEADKKMSAKEKKDALEDLNQALKAPAPAIENKGNIDLVAKYYDKLAAVMSEDE
jgi:hypothetical protein